jgi:hypothetical protein
MNKFYKIGIIIAIGFGLIIATLYFVSLSKRKNQIQTPDNQSGEDISSGSTGGNGMPIENILGTVMRIEKSDNPDQIKKAYDDYVKQDYKTSRYIERDGVSDLFAPSDKEANLVPIETFLSSIGASINSKVKSIVGANYYSLFYCVNEKKQKEYGIAFDLSDKDSAKTKSNYSSALDVMVDWEPYLLKDIHNIIFPLDNMGDKDINQSLSFKNGEYRYTDVNLPNRKGSINYEVIGDPLNLIIITTSPNCLNKVVEVFSGLD